MAPTFDVFISVKGGAEGTGKKADFVVHVEKDRARKMPTPVACETPTNHRRHDSQLTDVARKCYVAWGIGLEGEESSLRCVET